VLVAGTVMFWQVVLGIHILAAIVAFGVMFAYPILFAAAARTDPEVTPWLLRSRQRIGRYLVNPGLLVLVVAGIYLASKLHQWGVFYVQWGLGAAIVIGAIEGSVVIRRSGTLATIAERDLAATAVPAGGRRTSATWSPEYTAGSRALWGGGLLLEVLVVITVFFMAIQLGS
jgi:uncharacterized membrane protein